MDALRQHLEPILARQAKHPVHPKVEVLWDEPCSIAEVTMRLGAMVERVAPEVVVRRAGLRERLIRNEQRDPLRWACEPPVWRAIDLEMCKKRLENPGLVLEMLVTGGIRAGKTEGATRRINANFFYSPRGWCVGLHETDITSRSIQQTRVHRFLPQELDTGTGKHKKDKRTKFSYSEGTGFTGSEFNIYWTCFDEDGQEMECGGRYEFRFYKQDLSTLQGLELTCATSDELVPLTIVKTVRERLSTRAMDTARPEFLARIEKAKAMLERGESLPAPLLGALYHGVHLITFTPKEGWNETVNSFLAGARKYGWVEAELLKGVPGVKDARVPRFAQSVERGRLVAYLHTSDNVMRPSYGAVAAQLEGKSEQEIRITAYGDVDRDWQSLFLVDPERHFRKETEMPAHGLVAVVADPAPAKPWAIKWYVVDPMNRTWVVQEWPCESWQIPGFGYPGAWAVPSESGRINGDPGPAQKLRLGWSCDWDKMHWLIYLGTQRLARRLRAVHGEKCSVKMETKHLRWGGDARRGMMARADLEMEGEMVVPEVWLMDSRFAGSPSATKGDMPTTVLEQVLDCENAPDWEPATGRATDEGYILLGNAFGTVVAGLPQLVCLEECTNTQFAWQVWTPGLPKDEACKDMLDPDRYLIEHDVEFHEPGGIWSGPVGGGSY